MPLLLPPKNRLRATISLLVLLLLVFTTGIEANAQKGKKRPASDQTAQQQGNANAATAQQQKPPKKNITPLHSGDTSEGSRITITSDAPLNDYSAYRSGNRYYVVIPEANAPRAQSGMRGRGFEDVQVEKRGNDAILSFKLQPGTNARVNQKFNRLDVELTTPGGGARVPTVTPTPAPTPAIATQPTPRPTPQTPVGTQIIPGTGIAGQTRIPPPQTNSNTANPALTPQTNGANPPVVYAPTPEAGVSPGVNPQTGAQASPAATPAADEVAQATQPSAQQPATTDSSASAGTTFGTFLQRNWLVVLIGALVLLSLIMIVAARSRAERTVVAPPLARKPELKEKRAVVGEKAVAKLKDANASSAVTAASTASAVASAQPEVGIEEVAASVEAVKAVEAEEKPVAVEEVAVEKGIVPAVAPVADVERVESEVKNVLAGESYNEEVIGASDAGTRQLVATELLSALASRNITRRERARDVFIKHNYLDEATKNLRTAEAPAERAAAARTLGYVKEKSTTPHLVAALEDEAPEVRRASVEALAELRDPSAHEPLSQLLEREKDRKVSKNLIRRAIEASATVEEETPPLEAEHSSADLAGLALAGGALVASLPVDEEVEISEEEAAAQREAKEEAARRREEEAARQRAEEERAQAAAEDARRQAAEEARLAAEAEAKRVAEEEAARQRAEEEARLAREAQERRQAEEAARLKAAEEEQARLKAAEEERQRQEEEARAQAAAEAARVKAEAEAREQAEAEERERQAEAERQRLEEEARHRAEIEARRLAEEEAERKRAQAARLAAEAQAKRQAEEEAARLRAEEEARQRALEEARLKAAEEARLAAEAEARRVAEEEEARRRAEAEARQRAEAEARMAAEAEAKRVAEEEAARQRAEEIAAAEALKATSPPLESLLGRDDKASSGWVDVDLSKPEAARRSTPPQVVDDTAIHELTPEAIVAEPPSSKEIVPSLSSVEEPVVVGKSGYSVSEKGIATLDEFSTVPATILKRLSSEEPSERAAAVTDLARVGGDDSFREISAAFDDPSVEVRNAAARSLFSLNADRAATFTRALREAPPERRRKIGSALASSGLASEAISQLMGESREKTYDAFSLLFLMSKAGEVQPLMRAIEEHPNNEVRLAVVKLLALSGQQEILPAFRRLAVRGSLPTEVRSAVMEAIYQISSQSPTAA